MANVGIIPRRGLRAGPASGSCAARARSSYQIVHELTQRGIGQSTCVGMGGDPVHGIGFIESLALFEADPETDLVVMIGEIGGDDEERAAAYIAEHVTKPVVATSPGSRRRPASAWATRARSSPARRGPRRRRPRRSRRPASGSARTPTEVAELVQDALA